MALDRDAFRVVQCLTDPRDTVDNYDRDDEEKSEQLDRNWNELLQELRVSQTGVQILTGFLLTMPLQPKFADLQGFTAMSTRRLSSCACSPPCC